MINKTDADNEKSGSVHIELEGKEFQMWVTKGSQLLNIVFGFDKISVTGWTDKPIVKKTYRIK